MNSWYDITTLAGGGAMDLTLLMKRYNQEEMLESVGISKLIDNEVGKLGDPRKVWVGGFSQGCALSLATMIHYPKALGGVIGLSGMNATQIDWVRVPEIGEKRKTPIFLYHGESDGVISQKIAKLTYDDLIK